MAERDPHDDLRDRPVGELLKELSNQTTTLVRQELELAKAEMVRRERRQASVPGCGATVASKIGR